MAEDLSDQATIQYGNTFLYAGGAVLFKGGWSKIYKYDPADEGWIEVPGKLITGKHGGPAILVKKEEFPACD